jgi:hypothetical protein
VFVWPDLKISEREKTLWASRRKSSVEINISREKEFIILIIKNILERVSGFFTNWSFEPENSSSLPSRSPNSIIPL